jgi:hypothetical protein
VESCLQNHLSCKQLVCVVSPGQGLKNVFFLFRFGFRFQFQKKYFFHFVSFRHFFDFSLSIFSVPGYNQMYTTCDTTCYPRLTILGLHLALHRFFCRSHIKNSYKTTEHNKTCVRILWRIPFEIRHFFLILTSSNLLDFLYVDSSL